MRKHFVTHPTLGKTTWKEIQKAIKGKRLCSWCRSPVPKGNRTRCGKALCQEAIWRAQSWDRCRKVKLREQKYCSCGKSGTEVDHIVPVSLGGTGDQDNLRTLCHECHKEATARLRKEKSKYKAF